MSAQTHKLGFGCGTIIDHGDGTVSYKRAGELRQVFRVRIADVTGFSVTKGSKTPELTQPDQLAAIRRTLRIFGNGTDLVTVSVGGRAAKAIEAWFRARPDFGTSASPATGEKTAPGTVPLESRLIANELTKLAELRDAGILTEDEFAAQKATLLG